MPFVTVDYFAGITDEQRRQLQERLAASVTEAFAAPAHSVRVFCRPFDPANVYSADGNHGATLPVIRVEFLPGRTAAQKKALLQKLGPACAEVLNIPVAQVRSILFEKKRHDWARGAEPVG